MVDWFVLLTPLVVLAVVLLLGFAGCDLVFSLDPVRQLTLEVGVPAALTVDASSVRFTAPGASQVTVSSLPRLDESAETFVLHHAVKDPPAGAWTAGFRLVVSDATGSATEVTSAMFTIDADAFFHTVRFEASGSPATNDFTIVFVGVTSDE